jgi:ribosomal protein S18 acetylase RimI-like enzyme
MGVRLLTNDSAAEVLAFLSARPIHTVIMSSLIRDNGLESELNRGRFYSYQNSAGDIEGVALIGHATLFETRSEAALAAFARFVDGSEDVRLIIGEQERVELFQQHFDPIGQKPHQLRRLLLFEQRWPILQPHWSSEIQGHVRGLRLAVPSDLELVVATHARMAVEEFGADNPIAADPLGFPRRCAGRIDRNRVWVLIEDGALVFKADVVSETPDAIYLEGIYVDPKKRGQGYGSRCLSQLSRCLLKRAGAICLFVDEENLRAQSFYRSSGYRFRGYYTTIWLDGMKRAREMSC